MITDTASIKIIFDRLIKTGNIVWDFEKAPHLFPLFLFLHFKEKYCSVSITESLQIEFFDFNYAFCRCAVTGLSENYSLWIQISKTWETATTFTVLIGDKEFIPFKNTKNMYATISLLANTYDGNAGTDVISHCHLRGCDFKVLGRSKEISDEIKEEMKKENFKFQTKAQ